MLTVTCETRESSTLAWESELFIGQGQTRLEFRPFHKVGTVLHSGIHQLASVSAILTNNSVSNNVRTLSSQLYVQLSSSVQSDFLGIVTCVNVGLNVKRSISVRVQGM